MKPIKSATMEYHEPNGRRTMICTQGGMEGYKERRSHKRLFTDRLLGKKDRRKAS